MDVPPDRQCKEDITKSVKKLLLSSYTHKKSSKTEKSGKSRKSETSKSSSSRPVPSEVPQARKQKKGQESVIHKEVPLL